MHLILVVDLPVSPNILTTEEGVHNRGGAFSKDEIVYLLPNELASNQEDFHELVLVFSYCIIHHGEKIKAEVPYDVKRSPTCMIEGA
jgi:hypothetical protein